MLWKNKEGKVGGKNKKVHRSIEAATKLTATENAGQPPRSAQPLPTATEHPHFQKLARARLRVHVYQLS